MAELVLRPKLVWRVLATAAMVVGIVSAVLHGHWAYAWPTIVAAPIAAATWRQRIVVENLVVYHRVWRWKARTVDLARLTGVHVRYEFIAKDYPHRELELRDSSGGSIQISFRWWSSWKALLCMVGRQITQAELVVDAKTADRIAQYCSDFTTFAYRDRAPQSRP